MLGITSYFEYFLVKVLNLEDTYISLEEGYDIAKPGTYNLDAFA